MRPHHPLVVLPLVAAALLAGAPARADDATQAARAELSVWAIGLGRLPSESASLAALVTTRTFVAPALRRYGTSETIELRAAAASLALDKASDPSADALHRPHGLEDVAFGARWRVREGDAGWLPGIAWLADVETPTGSHALRGPAFRPSVRATAEWDLPQDWTVGMTPGVFLDRDEHGKRYGAGVLAVTLGKAWTPRWRTFVELAAQRQAGADAAGASLTLDGGLALRASDTLQLDLAVSSGLTSGAPELQAALGLSARF